MDNFFFIQPHLHLHFCKYPHKMLNSPSAMTVYDVSCCQNANDTLSSIQIIPSAYNIWIWSYNSAQDCNFLCIGSQSRSIFIDLSAYTNHLAVLFDADTAYFDADIIKNLCFPANAGKNFDTNTIHNNLNTNSLYPCDLRNQLFQINPQSQNPHYSFISKLLHTHSFDEHIEILLNYINQYTKYFPFPVAFQNMADLILHTNEPFSLQDISVKTRYSVRHINRMFHKYFGYGPKTLYKYIRFQKVLLEIIRNPNRQISEFILNIDYSDQAHFQREFKTFMGETPKSFCRQICQSK